MLTPERALPALVFGLEDGPRASYLLVLAYMTCKLENIPMQSASQEPSLHHCISRLEKNIDFICGCLENLDILRKRYHINLECYIEGLDNNFHRITLRQVLIFRPLLIIPDGIDLGTFD